MSCIHGGSCGDMTSRFGMLPHQRHYSLQLECVWDSSRRHTAEMMGRVVYVKKHQPSAGFLNVFAGDETSGKCGSTCVGTTV